MSKKSSPMKNAHRVIEAFIFPKVGAKVSCSHIEEQFRRHNIPHSECMAGIHCALKFGWIEIAPLNYVTLTEAGFGMRTANNSGTPAVKADTGLHVQ